MPAMTTLSSPKSPLIISALRKEKTTRTPVWLMRQAGRYLPEYRALREASGGFLEMVYHPETASEITMQPIRRFGMDGAILFSDILVIPQALGQKLWFEQGEGPRLDPARDTAAIDALSVEMIDETLSPIYETLKLTRSKLDAEGYADTALIGFCGGLWTVACYMITGRGSKDFAFAKQWAVDHPQQFSVLMDKLHRASLHYLEKQAHSGAQAVQIFESWAGVLDEAQLDTWVIEPTKKLVSAFKQTHPDIPVIGFPRGVSAQMLERYAQQTGVDGLGIDQLHKPEDLKHLQSLVCIQGNLDNELLLRGGEAMADAARAVLSSLAQGPLIFNLGHGVIKETPPEHVAQLVQLVQEYTR